MMAPENGLEVTSTSGGPGQRPPNSIPAERQGAAATSRCPDGHNDSANQNGSLDLLVETPSAPETSQSTTGDVEHEGLLRRFAKGKLEKFSTEQNLLLAVSALIITLSFAAVPQPPGGMRTDVTVVDGSLDDSGQKIGQANLLGQTESFWVFFIANGSAMATASSAVLLLVSCPPRKDMQAFVIIMLARLLVWLAIECSLTSFCAAVWIIAGRKKYKVLPFFIAAAVLYVCFTVVFICGQMIRATARNAKRKIRKVHARHSKNFRPGSFQRASIIEHRELELAQFIAVSKHN